MRNTTRAKVEYLLFCSVMTTGTVILTLANTLGFDEEGRRRTPVFDQPFSESLREARLELKEYQDRKANQWKTWATTRGYGDGWNRLFGNSPGRSSSEGQVKPPQSFLQGLEEEPNDSSTK
jgi:hypothetical protein